ncbi:drug/metabolite transporter (DMT)-like permease [Dyadobacter sp. BE34]|uniref:Drug/metabolite transporter (DMT)-like permease n=1 Tax=Dyadobacter fermentans TaxID=94254 RepID=A0ABU1QZV8_9BACT|nr:MULTISPECIES: DMT family transporter [Dyadobacter]MDR6806692.1 drug/metabolite transporter (DMT)-like permease [Dyadobacter fermentans]MDR7044434.1 drug/metabolite transporter (DMT)-like permease [Dyadobacter sp. BE242]MDR7198744.1 drug/metabolite transporter (DMT)-like permease [Dyadobacter sp. BE34]MDR7216706.1 drug/metabolite transporter (DMT)-like permease [Dyadobacter sp. BE31]MDR7263768.1 drug/metabolite transporter (DMT)-like permease [Dyadobacter sp. BE32]
MQNQAGKGIAMVLMGASLWGVSGTFSQFLFQQQHISVEWLMSVRMLISGIVLVAISKARKNADTFAPWKDKRDAIRLLSFGISGMLTVQYTYFAAIKHSNAATATILQFTSPIIIAVYLAVKFKKPLRPLNLVAIAVAMLGTFLLVTHGKPGELAISGTALAWGLASAVSLAMYTIQPESLLKRYHETTIIGWGLLIGGIGISLVRAPWHTDGIWDVHTYAYTAFVVLFGTLIPFYAYLTGVKLIGGQKASLLTSAEPLSTALLSVSWLGVPFLLMDYIGAGLIISTVFLLAMERDVALEPPVV